MLITVSVADHSAQEHIQIGAGTNGQGPNQLCNGVAGKGRTCFNFTASFTESFNSWHEYMTNKSQDMLSKTTGGPVICGPHASYGKSSRSLCLLKERSLKDAAAQAAAGRATSTRCGKGGEARRSASTRPSATAPGRTTAPAVTPAAPIRTASQRSWRRRRSTTT